MKSKSKKLLVSLIIGASLFTMVGCKQTVKDTGLTQEELDEKYSDNDLQNSEIIKGNYKDITPEEAIEFEEFVKSFHNDMKKVIFENPTKKGSELDLSKLADKYFVKDSNNVNIEGYYKDLHNVYDGYDGKIDNKLTDSKKENINRTESAFFDYKVITDAFNVENSDGWFNIDSSVFSNVIVKEKDIKEDSLMMVYNAGNSFDEGYGLFHRTKKKDLSSIVFDNYDFKQDKLLSIVVEFTYDFEKDYPVINNEDINNAFNDGADILEVMFVKTNDGWKVLMSKFITFTQCNQHVQ